MDFMPLNSKIIDAHTHVFPQWAELAVRVMDRCSIKCSVTLGWEDAFGDSLLHQLSTFNRYPGRFAPLCNIDWSRIDSPGFDSWAADQLEIAVEKGCRGLKIFKSLGLSVKDNTGELIRVNDARLDRVWDRAGILGVPVLIHTADPAAFWQPLNRENFWGGVLNEGYSHWSYYRKGFPSRDELLGERDCLLNKHPKTNFVAPHLASLSDDPLTLQERLVRYPNLYVDISARLPAMSRTEKRRLEWRSLVSEMPDRFLFGSDLIYDDEAVRIGVQSQTFQLPEEAGIVGMDNESAFEKTSAEYVESHLEFLNESSVQPTAPFRREKGTFILRGLGLDNKVLEKVLCYNAEKIYGIKT